MFSLGPVISSTTNQFWLDSLLQRYYAGPPLQHDPYHWEEFLVLAVATLCFGLLCHLGYRGTLSISRYLLLALLPVLSGSILSVAITIAILQPFWSPGMAYIGASETDSVIYALFCAVIGCACTVLIGLTFGIVIVVRWIRTRTESVTRAA